MREEKKYLLIRIPNYGLRIVDDSANCSFCDVLYKGSKDDCEKERIRYMHEYWQEKTRNEWIEEKTKRFLEEHTNK